MAEEKKDSKIMAIVAPKGPQSGGKRPDRRNDKARMGGRK